MSLNQIIVQLNPDVSPSGSDLAVVNAARRSFGKRSIWDRWDEESLTWVCGEGLDPTKCKFPFKGLKLKPTDENLIKFLARGMTSSDWEEVQYEVLTFENGCEELRELLWQWRNTPTHDTPFNHCHISFEVKAPIFVARQLVKTEYAPFSEFSRRYITEDVEFYLHDYRMKSEDKKQGSGGIHPDNKQWQKGITEYQSCCLAVYNLMIADGVAPEQARGVLPVDLMTSWTWSATLGAFAKMCRERLGSDAQLETRYVAEQVYKHLKTYFPVSAKALVEGC